MEWEYVRPDAAFHWSPIFLFLLRTTTFCFERIKEFRFSFRVKWTFCAFPCDCMERKPGQKIKTLVFLLLSPRLSNDEWAGLLIGLLGWNYFSRKLFVLINQYSCVYIFRSQTSYHSKIKCSQSLLWTPKPLCSCSQYLRLGIHIRGLWTWAITFNTEPQRRLGQKALFTLALVLNYIVVIAHD